METFSYVRPSKSSFLLLEFLKEDFVPMIGDWVTHIDKILTHYFVQETRTDVRKKVREREYNRE